jgi:2-hydroxy-6-oxonona-2,4-dienedioate hydrolase
MRWPAALALLVIATVAAGVLYAFKHDMDQAWARLAGRSHVIATPYGAMEYGEAGAGPPVLVIHGSGGGFDQGLAFADRLPSAGFRVIAPSRFGYLRSDFPLGASPEMQADAMAHLMDRLGLKRAIIFGGSAGALSATQLALRHPDRCQALVLLVPAIYAPDRRPNESAAPNALARGAVQAFLGSDFLFWAAIRLAPDVATKTVLATPPELVKRAPAPERARIRTALLDILPISARRRGLALDSATAGVPVPYPLRNLRCPVLAISARDDLYGTGRSAAYAASQAPDGRLVLYDDGGHMLVGHDEDVWRRIAAFARTEGEAR